VFNEPSFNLIKAVGKRDTVNRCRLGCARMILNWLAIKHVYSPSPQPMSAAVHDLVAKSTIASYWRIVDPKELGKRVFTRFH